MKRKTILLSCMVLVCLFAAAPIFGQEDGGVRFGFFSGIDRSSIYTTDEIELRYTYPPYAFRIGGMIEPVPSVLIKPDIVLRTFKEERSDKLAGTSHTNFEGSLYGGGLSILYSFLSFEKVSIYAGPRFDYLRHKGLDYRVDKTKDDQSIGTSWYAAACIAGQYRFSDTFRCFAEIGIGYGVYKTQYTDWDASENKISETERTYPGFLAYSGQVGFAFYF